MDWTSVDAERRTADLREEHRAATVRPRLDLPRAGRPAAMATPPSGSYIFFVDPAHTYRTRLLLRIAVGASAALWAGVLIVLVGAPGAEPQAILGAAAFSAFFLAFTFVYRRTWIAVTAEGIVSRTPFRVRPVRFEDILEIVVQDGLAGRVYAIVTRRGLIQFTSLFARHRELFELLLDRAKLQPR
jgi:hypothetical protein